MKNHAKSLLKKPFIRNVLMLSSGTAFAQAINMLFSPLLTRLYGPEGYGVMGSFASIISIIIPIAGLAYSIAIVLPKEEEEALALSKISLLVTGFMALTAAILLILFNDNLATLFGLEALSAYLYLIPLVIIFAGAWQVLEKWSIRNQEFGGLAKSGITESMITNFSKLIVGFIYPSPVVLVFFTTLKNGIKVFFIRIYNRKSIFKLNDLLHIKNTTLTKVAKKYKDFPLFRAPRHFLNSITSNLPLLLLTGLFGASSAGFFSIGKTVLGVPSMLIGKSVGDVFYPRISRAVNSNEKVAALIKKATAYLSLLGIVPYGIIVLLGPFLFSFIYGQEWIIAGRYAQWLSLWMYTDFVRMVSINTLTVLSKQNFLLVFTVLLLIVQTGSFLIGYYIFNSGIVSIALFSISGTLLNIVLILFTISLSKKFDEKK